MYIVCVTVFAAPAEKSRVHDVEKTGGGADAAQSDHGGIGRCGQIGAHAAIHVR